MIQLHLVTSKYYNLELIWAIIILTYLRILLINSICVRDDFQQYVINKYIGLYLSSKQMLKYLMV